MSLIADALKAAEKNKAQRLPPPPRGPQPSHFSLRFPARGAGEPVVSPLVIGIGVATAAIALVVLVLTFSPSQKKPAGPAAAAAPLIDSIPSTLTLETPGDLPGAGLTDIDPGLDAGQAGLDPYLEDLAPRQASPPPSRRVLPADTDNVSEEPLPSSTDLPPRSSPSRPAGRLQITVERPIQSSDGGGLFEQGLAAQRRGDFMAAKNYYLQATYLAPRNPELFNNLGTVYRALQDLPAAEAAYRQATDVDSRFGPAWSNLGVVLGQQGRTREATVALQQAVRLEPENAAAKVNLAIQMHASGLLADARNLLEEALRIDPGLAEAHYELGRVLEKQNERTAAIRQYQLFLSNANGRFPDLEQAVRNRLRSLSP